MNEEALNAAHKHFTDTGYNGSIEEFSTLLKSNEKALDASFDYFKSTGYNGDKSKFSTLLGLKNVTPPADAPVEESDMASSSEKSSLALPSFQNEDGSFKTVDQIAEEHFGKENVTKKEKEIVTNTIAEAQIDEEEKIFLGLTKFEDVPVTPYIHTSWKDPNKLYYLDDIINLSEEDFEKEFSEYGVQVEKIGIGVGNAVRVAIPGEESMYIDLSPSNKNTPKVREQVKKLLDFRNDIDVNVKDTFTVLNPDKDNTLGDISQEKLNVFNNGDYKITKTFKGVDVYSPSKYNVTNLDGEVVASGTHNDIKQYMIANPQSKEGYDRIKQVQDDVALAEWNKASNAFEASEQLKNVTFESAAGGYYDDNLTGDIMDEFNIDPTFGGIYKNNEESTEITGGIKSGIDFYFKSGIGGSQTSGEMKEIKEKKIRNFDSEKLLKDIYTQGWAAINKAELSEDEFVERFLPHLQKAWNNVYEEVETDKKSGNKISGGLDKKIAKYKKDQIAKLKNTYIENQMSESGLGDVVTSSIRSTRREFEEQKNILEKRTEFFVDKRKQDTDILKADFDSLGNELTTWYENNKEHSISVEYHDVANGDGWYEVNSSDSKAQNMFQKKYNTITSRANDLSKTWKTTQDNLDDQWNTWQAAKDERENTTEQLETAAMKDYDWSEVLGRDISSSFKGMALDIPILFGSKNALKVKNEMQEYDATYLPTMGTAGENWDNGSLLFYSFRTLGQQLAPLTLAIGGGYGATTIFGSIRGATIAKNVVPAFYGITSAGSKFGELTTLEDEAREARGKLQELNVFESQLEERFKAEEIDQETYDQMKEVYREQRINLNTTIADGTMTSFQKYGLTAAVGAIEFGVTKFGFKVPNALKLTRDLKTPLYESLKYGTRNGYQNSLHALGKFSWRAGGEIIEEETIYGLSTLAEGQFLNKDMKYDQWDDVLWSTLIVASPTNGLGVAYSSVLSHYATRDMYNNYIPILQELKANKKKFGDFWDPSKKGYQNHQRNVREERFDLLKKLSGLNSELEVMALLNVGKTGDLLSIGNQINELNRKANVDVTLSPDAQDKQRDIYISSLDSKTEQKEFKDEYDAAIKAKKKIINKISFKNAIEKLYGVEGKRVRDKLIKNDPSLKEDPKALVIAVHEEFKARHIRNRAAITRKDEGLLLGVEQVVYGMSFEDYKKQTGRKNRNRKKEDEILARWGDQLGIMSRNSGLILNKEESINAAQVLKDVNLKDLDLKVSETDEDLQINILNAYDAQKKKVFDTINRGINPFTGEKTLTTAEQKENARALVEANFDEQAEGMIHELRMGETNAAIIGDQYIVKDKKAAVGEIKNGNLLAGTAISHEIGHAVDTLTFASEQEGVNYAQNLYGYMSEGFQDIHNQAMMRMRLVGGNARYNENIPLEEQSSLFWDEYTKSIQDVLSRGRYNAERRQILNEGQATMNKFRAMIGGDYKINTGRDAAVYLASYIDNFKKGKLGELQKRRIDPAEKRRQKQAKKEGLKEAKKSANIKSPLLHEQANETGKKVNNLYTARDSNPNWRNDIAQLYDSMLGKYLTSLENKGVTLGKVDEYGNVNLDDKRNNISDFKSNAMYGNRGIIDVIDSFKEGEMVDVVDPRTGETVQEENTISKYINGLLPQRLPEFLKDTTIDFTGFKVDISKAENIVTTETDQAINDILTLEVQDQLNTPFLNNVELTKEQVNALRTAITTIVGGKLPALDAAVSKNRSVSPLVAALKKEFGVKNGPLHRIVQEIIGDNPAAVEAYLRNPKNKRAMLQTLTTTWLSKNLPMAVEKKVIGVGYTTDHLGRKKGKKSGDIEAWKSSEEGPYKGMTDGKQKIRRNPNANTDVSNAMLLSNFAKGQTMTEIRRAGLEKLELALAQEFGMEVFKADMINDGDLKDLFVGRQDLFDRVLNDNFVEEFVRQTERGVTKRSANPKYYNYLNIHESSTTPSSLDASDVGTLYDLAWKHGIESKEVKEQADSMHANIVDVTFEELLYPNETLDGPNGFKPWVNNSDFAPVLNFEGKRLQIRIGKDSNVDLQKNIADSAVKIFETMHPDVASKSRKWLMFALGFKDGRSVKPKDFSSQIAKINKAKVLDKQSLLVKEKEMRDAGFDPKIIANAQPMVYSGRIKKIIDNIWNATDENGNYTKKAKRDKYKEYKQEILEINEGNKMLMEYLTWEMQQAKQRGDIDNDYVYAVNQMQTNIVEGSRAMSTFEYMYLPEGRVIGVPKPSYPKPKKGSTSVSQEQLNKYNEKIKAWKNSWKQTIHWDQVYNKINTKSEYKDRIEKAMERNGWTRIQTVENLTMKEVNPKNEHIGASASTHGKRADQVFSNGKSIDTNGKVSDNHKSMWGPTFIMDEYLDPRGGKVNYEGDGRIARHIPEFVSDIYHANESNVLDYIVQKKLAENSKKKIATPEQINTAKRLDKAMSVARKSQNPSQGITILDFDDTLATSKSQVISTSPDGTVRKLTAEEFAKEGADLLDQGWTHDFSEFSKVIDGKVARLFEKALKLQGKFGPENMFVLTARPADSAQSIYEFLKANGLNIPLKNITGLANSTAEAKALWVADKVAEGYNDFYFADDALQNVQAVKNMLDQFDVKSKVQQAKRSANFSIDFNKILEATTGIESQKQFSDGQAKLRGAKTKYKSIIPASAQDFQGLLYSFLGKGKQGEADMAFFKKHLIDPFARGVNELNSRKQSAANDFANLNKKFKDVKKKLHKKIKDSDYTHDQAIRVYLWNKAGFEIPGLSKRDLKILDTFVKNDPVLREYADAIGLISKKENGYSAPKDYWLAENIASDLLSDGAIGDVRSEHLAEWIENKNVIFSPDNLNKIEAIYGSKFIEALEDMLYRMETGRNRPMGGSRLVNGYLNWVNNSVGAIMFFNLRSATLQTISAVNYINWNDNNPLKAGMAFANQKQFWSDFAYIFNSDFLKQRRSGNQRGINEAEISDADAGSDNKAKAAIAWLLKKGFTPTQIADSFAISMGGSTFYRNRIKTYEKQGFTTKEAEAKAFLDFQEITEVNQQSARPDMISMQQASPLGRLILAFQNTPMQYARIMNKATRDLYNNRGDAKTHVSKIVYYGVVQSILFGALQSALYASLGDDEEEVFDKKKQRILNQMVDSWLSGIGVGGKAIGTMKNSIMEYLKQRDRGFRADHAYTMLQLLSFSPPIGSKLRKIYTGIKEEQWSRDVFFRRGFTLDNPIWSAIGNVVEGITNAPLGRMSNLMLQLDNAMDANHKTWQRIALLLGQNTWDLGIQDPDIEALKIEIKEEKKLERAKERQRKKAEKEEEKRQERDAIIEKNKEKSKEDGICAAVSVSGKRCKNKAVKNGLCTIHEKTEQRKDGKQTQCKKVKSNGDRCKMKTTNKSGLCYYHD